MKLHKAAWPFISVVIPAYNEAAKLPRVLSSLHAQDYPGMFEIIVADNNSTDRTVTIAKKSGARVVHQTKKGVAYARQAGFYAASGDYIASTDADSIVPSDWLTRLATEFTKHPKAVAVTGMYRFYDDGLLLRVMTWLFNFPLFTIFDWYSGANMMVEKQAFLKIGGFDVSVPLSEDSDICRRLRTEGQVLRLPFFKIETSARRFNQLGFFGGLWDYSFNYIKLKTGYKRDEITFRSGSEVARLPWFYKLSISTSMVFILLTSAASVTPVRAQVIKHHPHIHVAQRVQSMHNASVHMLQKLDND